MTEIIAVFRSRSQAMDCVRRLKTFNIPVELINTPREANVGCGLSIKLPQNDTQRVKNTILRMGYPAFFGFFKMENRYGKLYVTPTF